MEKRIYIKAHLNTDRTFRCKTLREANLLVHDLQFQGWRIIDMFEQERILPTIRVYIWMDYGQWSVETSENNKDHRYYTLRELRAHLVKNGIKLPLVRKWKKSLMDSGSCVIDDVPYDSELDLDEIAA